MTRHKQLHRHLPFQGTTSLEESSQPKKGRRGPFSTGTASATLKGVGERNRGEEPGRGNGGKGGCLYYTSTGERPSCDRQNSTVGETSAGEGTSAGVRRQEMGRGTE